MNPHPLLERFDRIAEAPDAVARLRRFILDLAVRGKLVEQVPDDEPASELLKRIAEEKARLVKAGDIKKPKPSKPIQRDELPIEIPSSWVWIRLCDLGRLSGGMTPSKTKSDYWNGDVVWLSPKDIKMDEVSDSELKITSRGLSETRLELFSIGSLFIVARSGILKRTFPVAINRVAAASNQDLKVLVPYLKGNERYLQIMFRGLTDFILRELVKTGTTVQSLKYAEFEIQPLPLPPIAEQHRIVAKVDELMALCDRLEAAQTKREQRRDRLVAASLRQLQDEESLTQRREGTKKEKEASRKNFCAFAPSREAIFLRDMPRLTTRPEHIKSLRQTILNLAVRGRLVPQDPNDEPVSMTLTQNDAQRKATAVRDRRADADPQELLAAEEKWGVPLTWQWRGLADLALFIDYRGKTPAKVNVGIRLITAKNVRPGYISLSPEEFVSTDTYEAWMTRGIPNEGDVLFTTEAPMGNAAVVHLNEKFALAQRVINFRPYGAIDADFLVLQILSGPFQRILDNTATGLTAKGIKAAKLKRLPLTIPPLAEQHRIVARVDELMAVCDQLEAELTTTQTNSCRLLEAVLHEALAPATDAELAA